MNLIKSLFLFNYTQQYIHIYQVHSDDKNDF